MFVTNASIRRYIRQQLETMPDAPPKCVERYECYVWCVAKLEHPKSFKEWMND